ncbi:peptidase M9 [Photobacterium frigidiphilum]|uniref:microbial collagenase n=1 Tax=Photobacterium frigidiphilum TaxID=264736 RepID=A0A2T3J5P7_9GAMM|nr:collagenase [Photobacterium frigidiphilum]PSU41357.1 peptidase M9 [Photobacterium frigidiphilum]
MIIKKNISILIASLLVTTTAFANSTVINQSPLSPAGTNLIKDEPVRRLSITNESIAPISIPPPTLDNIRESTLIEKNIMMDISDNETCQNYDNFSLLSGKELFNFIRTVPRDCIDKLYTRNDSISVSTYQPSKVIDIAHRATQIASTYDSSTGDDMYNLFYYLRGAFFIENSNEKLTYSDKLPNQAMLSLLEAYSRNPHIFDISDNNDATLGAFFTTWGSSSNQVQSVKIVTRYLNEFGPEHLKSRSHRNALTSALTLLYRASWDATYTKAAEQHIELRQALLKIANSEYIYNSEYSYQSTDALKEYARFIEYQKYWKLPETLKNEINNGIVGFMSRFERFSKLWSSAAARLDHYNSGECEKFNICGWKEGLANQILSIHYSCSDTIKIRAQEMTEQELQQSCDLLATEEILFHKVLKTNNQPVNDDHNTSLEVNIFDSSDEYRQYAGDIFGISTDNGGMYLEGDPSAEGNQARFIAHEATWLDDILVWNLRHEYIHYLDGRFNKYGSFNQFRTDTGKSVWWSEGLAEYISHQNRYDEAIDFARQRNHRLSEIMNNNYSSGSERVYQWGYLAVRFMFEEAPEMVDQLMSYARTGDADGWLNYINSSIGSSLDNQWNDWLLSVQSDDSQLIDKTLTPSSLPDSCKYQGAYGYGIVNYGETLCVDSQNGKASYYFYVDDNVSRININTDYGNGNIKLFYNANTWADSSHYSEKSMNVGYQQSLTIIPSLTGNWQYVTVISEPSTQGVSLKLNVTTK